MFPTHDFCHPLELIITNDLFKLNIHKFYIDTCISDHKTICVDLNLPKPHIKKKNFFLTAELIISISLNLIKIFLLHFLILNFLI